MVQAWGTIPACQLMFELSCVRSSFIGGAETKITPFLKPGHYARRTKANLRDTQQGRFTSMYVKCKISQDLIAQLQLCAVDDAQWEQSPCRARSPHPTPMAA